MKKKVFDELEANKIIKRVNGTMAMEGMPLTDEEKKIVYDCLSGKSTFEKERKKIIEECKKIYG